MKCQHDGTNWPLTVILTEVTSYFNFQRELGKFGLVSRHLDVLIQWVLVMFLSELIYWSQCLSDSSSGIVTITATFRRDCLEIWFERWDLWNSHDGVHVTLDAHHGEVGVVSGKAQAKLGLQLRSHTLQHAVEYVVVPLIWSLEDDSKETEKEKQVNRDMMSSLTAASCPGYHSEITCVCCKCSLWGNKKALFLSAV